MIPTLLIALFFSLLWGNWQKNRAKSAENILEQQNELLEYQDFLLKNKK